MGFRSSLATSDNLQWPDWFREKYPWLNVPEDGSLSTAVEQKFYGLVTDPHTGEKGPLLGDIRKVYVASGETLPFVLILLHECGDVTRAELTWNGWTITEPTGWAEKDRPTHSHCECWSTKVQKELEAAP